MELLKFVRLIVVLVPMVSGEHNIYTSEETRELGIKKINLLRNDPKQGQVMCARLLKEPYFGVEMLLGDPWNIYYSWNMDLNNQCMNLTFTKVTLAIVNRFYNDMNEYLEAEPNWDAASLLIIMGRERNEMLLFAEQGTEGMFQGVPNMIRDGNIYPERRSVPLLRFYLKFTHGGKYLLMADCQLGVTTLSTRVNKFPLRAAIENVVSSLDMGSGHHTCHANKNKSKKNAPKE